MCLGVPMQVVSIADDVAVCEIDGVRREASLLLVEGIGVGDFVLIHAGFAIEKLNEADAAETLRLFRQLVDQGMAAE